MFVIEGIGMAGIGLGGKRKETGAGAAWKRASGAKNPFLAVPGAKAGSGCRGASTTAAGYDGTNAAANGSNGPAAANAYDGATHSEPGADGPTD